VLIRYLHETQESLAYCVTQVMIFLASSMLHILTIVGDNQTSPKKDNLRARTNHPLYLSHTEKREVYSSDSIRDVFTLRYAS